MNLYNLLILALIPGILAAIVDTNQELICETENDCYPKVLIPSREWQPIRKNQDIPAGLHVRLNIDTLEREAKILEEDENMDQQQFDLAVHENQETDDVPSVAPTGKIDSYDSAVKEVIYGKDEARLAQALDILVDISHDVEYGEKLTSKKQPFQQLLKFAHSSDDAEKIYRIIGTSLRNNPEAIRNFLTVQDPSVIADLFQQLSNPNDKVQKRILGIIQALLQNDTFRFAYFNINDLISKYDILGPESKLRFINILEDLGLSKSKRSEDQTNPDEYFSNYLQSKLVAQDFESTKQFATIFDELTKLHENNKSLQPSSDFMQWLSKEVETRKENTKRDELEIAFDQEMLRRRHEVFGNPNAMRKAMMDEL